MFLAHRSAGLVVSNALDLKGYLTLCLGVPRVALRCCATPDAWRCAERYALQCLQRLLGGYLDLLLGAAHHELPCEFEQGLCCRSINLVPFAQVMLDSLWSLWSSHTGLSQARKGGRGFFCGGRGRGRGPRAASRRPLATAGCRGRCRPRP